MRIAEIATAVGFGMMIGGAIIGSFPLVAIGFVVGLISMLYAKYQSMMLEEEHYKAVSKDFSGKLDEYLNKSNVKSEEICKALNEVKEIVEHEDSLEVMEHGTNELANRILTINNIGKIFKCLESEDEKVKSSAANLIRAALIQDRIDNNAKVAILTRLAKMAKTENSNSNNNDNNNNDILEKCLGKDALDSLKALKLPNKKSAGEKQDKNHKQSQIKEEDLSKIIESIKNHTLVSQ